MKTPKWIINFTVCAGIDEPIVLYFYDEKNAREMYESLKKNDIVVDLYLSKVAEGR